MKSGNIILIGPTNSGKSTLINTIIGKRVTLVSRKKQSTTFNQNYTNTYLNTNIYCKILLVFLIVQKR